MTQGTELLRFQHRSALDRATLVLAFTGWMDGGDVSTGTVHRLDLLGARPFAEIDPEPFYIYNFPGSMETAALFRPEIKIEDGLIWRTFGDCVLELARLVGVRRMLFVDSF